MHLHIRPEVKTAVSGSVQLSVSSATKPSKSNLGRAKPNPKPGVAKGAKRKEKRPPLLTRRGIPQRVERWKGLGRTGVSNRGQECLWSCACWTCNMIAVRKMASLKQGSCSPQVTRRVVRALPSGKSGRSGGVFPACLPHNHHHNVICTGPRSLVKNIIRISSPR
jgi:hypothetical protein